MTTENTPGAELEPARTDEGRVALIVVNPATGTIVELDAPAPELIDELDRVAVLTGKLSDYRRTLELELVRRVDNKGRRTALVDGCKLEVNAPTEDLYDVEAVLGEFEPLVEAGKVSADLLTELIVEPDPPPPPPARVDKRVVNALKSSDNVELLAALARARRRTENRRTVKVKGRPVEATAEEVSDE